MRKFMNNQYNPLISIIIPVYNVGHYLNKCLSSCLEQTYACVEIICVDDGSTDNSYMLLKKNALIDSRIKILKQENAGVVVARNNAISIANGEYLFFLDADDYIEKNAIKILVEKCWADQSDIVIANLFYGFNNRFKPMCFNVPSSYSKKGIIEYMLLDKLPLSLGAKLVKKSLWESIHVPRELKIGEDAYATLQLIYKAQVVSFVNRPVYFYENRDGSVMTKPSELALKSRVLFIRYVMEYFNGIECLRTDMQFQETMSVFELNQYYAFLRMGGWAFLTDALKEEIKRRHLDKALRTKLPYWRNLIIGLSLKHTLALKFFISIIEICRKVKYNFLY